MISRSARVAGLGIVTLLLATACDSGSTTNPDELNGAGSGAAAAPPAAGGTTGVAGASSVGGEATALPGSARAAAAGMGKGFNIGQMFESTQHAPTLASASAKIDAYYAKGFRTVRIPVTWTEATNGDTLVGDPLVGDVNRAHPRLQVISQVVDYALTKPDLFVVLNAHHETGLKEQSRAGVLERLWADIADIFAARDHRLLFEILNEPHREDGSAMPAADLRDMTSKAYAKIRAVDAQRIIVIGGNKYFAANEVPAVWSDLNGVGGGSDPYLMATFHHYNPWTFCGDNQGTYDDPWTDADLSGPMETMRTWASGVGKGMPVFIGEWGVGWGSRYTAFDCNNIRSWYQKFTNDFASVRNMPTVVWDDGGWFQIFDYDAGTFANNLSDCIVGSCDWSGTERFNAGCQ
ncbi:MAG TPA: cellulase family glycosylhydrolase [Polyangiaceae bacterium]|nr:cellulase family glycosylhydrolase [Polyangiaceae bacterium]